MKEQHLNPQTKYTDLLSKVSQLIEQSRQRAYSSVNQILVETYWEIGQYMVEHEQEGKKKAEYGEELLARFSQDLTLRYGKGFSRSNLQYMRLFYNQYPKSQTLSGKLSWSHYIELLMVKDDLVRSFYEKQYVREGWSLRELRRQINSLLFERIALSKDKEGVLTLAQQGQLVEKPQDAIKNPYILEFLELDEKPQYNESELEEAIISKLKEFILELGKDFLFVERQKRITISNRHYYIDLVFYHRTLKCFVLIDLKIGELTHADTGQMNFYLNYYAQDETKEGENKPIGLILCASKNKELAKYILTSPNIFASEYKLKLPSEELLKEELKKLTK